MRFLQVFFMKPLCESLARPGAAQRQCSIHEPSISSQAELPTDMRQRTYHHPRCPQDDANHPADLLHTPRRRPVGDVPTRVVSGQRLDDEREIITIGFVDVAPEDLRAGFERVAEQEQVRHDRIDEDVEPEMTRTFYLQVGDDDLS